MDSQPARSPLPQIDGVELTNLFQAGAVWLEQNVALVNSLNVFPVPDGDTGTNMLLTMQSAIKQAQAVSEPTAGGISAALSHGALLGARGNSGVILSQIFRGFARVVDKRETLDAPVFADALVEGARTAYKGVVKPVEGTILTVIRETADRAVIAASQSGDIRVVLEQATTAAHQSVARTPQLLPQLKEAGVVDAGGQGLAFILEGALKYCSGEPLQLTFKPTGAQNLPAFRREEGWGYDIQFHIRGAQLDVPAIRDTISALGESALIVGDQNLIKVHIHAPNPGDIIKYAAGQGALVNIIIENMQAQYLDFMAGNTAERRVGAENLGAILPHTSVYNAAATANATGIATIAVVSGPGLQRIFESLGISALIQGGPTMNPSTQDFLTAVEQVSADQVLLLPNDKNILLVANRVKELTTKQVQVIPSRTVPQGVAALLAFNAQSDLASNLEIMSAAMHRVRTIELTHAVRTATVNRVPVSAGQPIALLDGELVSAGDSLPALLIESLHLAGAEDSEIVTLYYGAEVSPAAAQEMHALVQHQFPEQEIELHSGAQPLYPYIISIE